MRPEENSRLRWESISWVNGDCGTLQVTHGKTAAARRMLPLSPRVRALLERRWEAAKMPSEGWVWAAATTSGHRGAFHDQETALTGTAAQWRASIRTLRSPAYVPHATGRVGPLRRMDAGADRGPLFHCHVRPVCSPQRRCRDECFLADAPAEGTSRERARHTAMSGRKRGGKDSHPLQYSPQSFSGNLRERAK
jgi:hypothetical protein